MKYSNTVGRRFNVFGKLIAMSYSELFLAWLMVNTAFAALYFTLNLTHPAHAPNLPASMSLGERLYDCFYFSFTTATTIGFGEIIPLGFSKMLVVIQSTLALLIFTVLVGKLVQSKAK